MKSTYGKIFIYYFIKVGGAYAYKDKKVFGIEIQR